ncbi:hypothetical protein AN958_01998 [Leucoagaricus sp. SymC.cos]|nr:hypothetical protein AN958_01998 [Leucoagaricus sp. SymC.cos]
MGHGPITLAIHKFITTTSGLRCRSTAPASTGVSAPLDIYIAHTIHDCRAPNLIAYATLYLLASISRNCSCRRSNQSDVPTSWSDADSDEPSKPPSFLSHRLSQAFTRSPLSRVRKSHWVEHHIFIGAFMVVLQAHQKNFDFEALSEISGFSVDELEQLQEAFVACMDKDTGLAIEWMIKEGEFRSLRDVECPVVVMRRRREKLAEKVSEEHFAGEHAHFRRLFSIRRSRTRTSSGSLESQPSMTSMSFSTSSYSP